MTMWNSFSGCMVSWRAHSCDRFIDHVHFFVYMHSLPAGLHVIQVLSDPINVMSSQHHFKYYSGARERSLWWTCQFYKAVKMIKVPFRNPEREGKGERPRKEKSADKHADWQSDRRWWGMNTKDRQQVEELQNGIRRYFFLKGAKLSGLYTVVFSKNYTWGKSAAKLIVW